MKKILLSLALLITTISSFSQSIPSSNKTKEYYVTKSRHQKTAAWIMLSGSVALTGLGIAMGQAEGIDYALGNSKSSNAGSVLGIVGIASMLGSIPVFISAAHNKHKAAALTFNMQKLPMLAAVPNRTAIFQPAVTLKIVL